MPPPSRTLALSLLDSQQIPVPSTRRLASLPTISTLGRVRTGHRFRRPTLLIPLYPTSCLNRSRPYPYSDTSITPQPADHPRVNEST
jgi:hypothetical protein